MPSQISQDSSISENITRQDLNTRNSLLSGSMKSSGNQRPQCPPWRSRAGSRQASHRNRPRQSDGSVVSEMPSGIDKSGAGRRACRHVHGIVHLRTARRNRRLHRMPRKQDANRRQANRNKLDDPKESNAPEKSGLPGRLQLREICTTRTRQILHTMPRTRKANSKAQPPRNTRRKTD